jgi:trigger factor
MAENESATAVEEQKFQYPIKVEDAGPATKRVTVEIPQERIATKMTEQFKELRQQAAIPGFRPGHAPQKLIEKRFATDVKEQVRRSLISESYEQALEKNSLQVLGEPTFDNPEGIQLPETGSLSFSFQVEVQPDIKLPTLSGLGIKKPKIDVSEENVDQAMQNLREQQGTLLPVEGRGVEAGDYLLADVHLKQNGQVVAHQHDAQIVARAGRVAAIQIDDLADKLKGMKTGESRTITAKAQDNHPREELRGKDVEIEVTLKDIKKLELAEISQEFLESLGFRDEKELREALREQLVERITYDVQQAMREQVNKYLLDNVQIELPTQLSEKQAERVVQRRAMDLLMRGMPREQIEASVQALRAGSKEEASRELKLFFILGKVATEQGVDVDESELNGRIAMLAAQRGQRPEKMKQEMAKDGTLANLYIQMREQKALDKILETATIEEVELPKGEKKEGAEHTST